MAVYSLTRNARSPFHAEPAHHRIGSLRFTPKIITCATHDCGSIPHPRKDYLSDQLAILMAGRGRPARMRRSHHRHRLPLGGVERREHRIVAARLQRHAYARVRYVVADGG